MQNPLLLQWKCGCGLQEGRILTALKISTVLLEWRDVSGRQTSGTAYSTYVHSWILGAVFIYWYRRTKCRQSWNHNHEVQFAWLWFCLEPLRAAFVPVFLTNMWKQKNVLFPRRSYAVVVCVCVCSGVEMTSGWNVCCSDKSLQGQKATTIKKTEVTLTPHRDTGLPVCVCVWWWWNLITFNHSHPLLFASLAKTRKKRQRLSVCCVCLCIGAFRRMRS